MIRTTSLAAVVAIAREKQITVNAASLAFYAFNSLIALTVLIYATFTVFGTGNVLATLLHLFTGVGAAEFQRLFDQLGGTTTGRRKAIAIALLIVVWSSLRLFRAMESVFAEVYEIRKERSVFRHLLDSLFVFTTALVAIALMVSMGVVYLFRLTGLLRSALGPIALCLLLSGFLVPIYYKFSDDDDSISTVLPGTVLAAVGWTGATIGLRVYVQTSASIDLYGIIGGVLLTLTWLYLVALSVLTGGILNAFLAGRVEPHQEWFLFAR